MAPNLWHHNCPDRHRPCGGAIVPRDPDSDGVAGDRHRNSKSIVGIGVIRFQIGLLAPPASGPRENVGGAGPVYGVVDLANVDSRRAAILLVGTDDEGVAGNGNGYTEAVARTGVAGLQIDSRNMLELVETLGFVVSESDDTKIRRVVKEL